VSSPFEQLAATVDYPMFIVTAVADGERSGCLMGFATQCSIRPIRFLACISVKNHTYGVAKRAEFLAVHLLHDEDRAIAELFGAKTGDEVDKFVDVAWHPGPAGMPILDAAKGWFAGPVREIVDLGDHHGFVIDPVEGDGAVELSRLLTFQETKDIQAGHPA